MRRIGSTLAIVAVLLLAACSHVTHEEEATAAGAVMGALVGSLFGDGVGKAAAAAVGGIAGGLAGGAAGRDRDEAERRQRERAALAPADDSTAR